MITGQRWVAKILVIVLIWSMLPGSVVFAADDAGQKVYQRDCQSCHGRDGTGNPQLAQALKTTIPLVTAAALAQKNDTEVLHVIAEGKGKMPGFAKKLSAEEQRQVLNYMKTLSP
jgi:cytochrome c6